MESKPMYETVALSDEHEEALSSTEVDESLMGDDKQWQPTRRSKRRSCLDTFRTYRWMIDTFLLLVIIGLLLLLRHEWADHELASPKNSPQTGGDYSGAGPHFEKKIVKFEQNLSFTPMDFDSWFSKDTLATWNTLMPVGTGWGNPGETFFTTSMTHQLHCVFMMGRMFSAVIRNTTERLPDNFLPHDWDFHFMHCVDYLRQSIMCSADVAVEPHEPDESEVDLGPLDGGWNGHHVCKDYGQVLKYLESQIADKVRVVLPIDD